jgi:hypothetical protein
MARREEMLANVIGHTTVKFESCKNVVLMREIYRPTTRDTRRPCPNTEVAGVRLEDFGE